jgi:hypothetical protein
MHRRLNAKKYTVTRKGLTRITPDGGTETIFQGGLEFTKPPELPVEWALLIGDFASNARAALDHLAWQLVLDNTWTPSRAKKNGRRWTQWPPKDTEFPIFVAKPNLRDPRRDKRLERRLSYFRPKPRATIAGLQPYKRGQLAKAEPLWMLKELRDADTHRELHTVLARIPEGAIRDLVRIVPSAAGGQEFYLPQQLKKALATLKANPGDVVELTLKLQANFAPYVTFDQRGAVFHGQEVLPLLHRCRDEVKRILGLF